jgi:branched-subunit amino acid aminotransferase/4-amino-4-deoxychorismate lyase
MTLLAVAVQGRGLVDPASPVFAADDEALLRGSAAFESLPVYGGRPFLLDRHLERLSRSVEGLGLAYDAAAAAELSALVARSATVDHAQRIYVTSANVVVTAADLPADLATLRLRGLSVQTVAVGAPSLLLVGVKATSYAQAFAARRMAVERGYDDAVFLGDGVVLDAATANVWWHDGEVLYTPAAGPGVLQGVTRGVVLELADELGLRVEQGSFPRIALAAAREAFMTSAIREVMPVVSLDGDTIGDGRPSPLALRLQEALRLRSRP